MCLLIHPYTALFRCHLLIGFFFLLSFILSFLKLELIGSLSETEHYRLAYATVFTLDTRNVSLPIQQLHSVYKYALVTGECTEEMKEGGYSDHRNIKHWFCACTGLQAEFELELAARQLGALAAVSITGNKQICIYSAWSPRRLHDDELIMGLSAAEDN